MENKYGIEQREFNDRIDFRVIIESDYPKGIKRKGREVRYASKIITYADGFRSEDQVFVAYRKNGFFKSFLGYDFRNQTRIAIQACEKIINDLKNDEVNSVIIREFKHNR